VRTLRAESCAGSALALRGVLYPPGTVEPATSGWRGSTQFCAQGMHARASCSRSAPSRDSGAYVRGRSDLVAAIAEARRPPASTESSAADQRATTPLARPRSCRQQLLATTAAQLLHLGKQSAVHVSCVPSRPAPLCICRFRFEDLRDRALAFEIAAPNPLVHAGARARPSMGKCTTAVKPEQGRYFTWRGNGGGVGGERRRGRGISEEVACRREGPQNGAHLDR